MALSKEDADRALARAKSLYEQAHLAHARGEIDDAKMSEAQALWNAHRRAYERATGTWLDRDPLDQMRALPYAMLAQAATLLTALMLWLTASRFIELTDTVLGALVMLAGLVLTAGALAMMGHAIVTHAPPHSLLLVLEMRNALLLALGTSAWALVAIAVVLPGLRSATAMALVIGIFALLPALVLLARAWHVCVRVRPGARGSIA